MELTARSGRVGVEGLLEPWRPANRTVRLRVVFSEHLLCSKWDTFLTLIEQPRGLQPDKEAAGRLVGKTWLEAGQTEFCPDHFGSQPRVITTPYARPNPGS